MQSDPGPSRGRVELRLAMNPAESALVIDGVEIAGVAGVRVEGGAGEVPRLVVEYACHELIDVFGEAVAVSHLCPMGGAR